MRYDIYAKVKELIEYTQSIHDYEKIDSMRVRALYVKLDEARFFFDSKVIVFINEVRQRKNGLACSEIVGGVTRWTTISWPSWPTN
jgi:hypothetical protein